MVWPQTRVAAPACNPLGPEREKTSDSRSDPALDTKGCMTRHVSPGPALPQIGVDARVFISYSRANQAFVLALAQGLQAHGITAWLDRDIVAGDHWAHTIQEYLRDCTHVIVVLSHAAAASSEVNKELALASALGKRFVPIRLDDSPSPREVEGIQYIDLRAAAMADTATTELVVSALRAIPVAASTRVSHERHYLDLVSSEVADRLRQSMPAAHGGGESLPVAGRYLPTRGQPFTLVVPKVLISN